MIINLFLLASCLVGLNVSNEGENYFENKICTISSENKQNNSKNNLNEWQLLLDFNDLKQENPYLSDEEVVADLYKKQSNRGYSYGDYELTDDEFWTIVLNLWPHQYSTAYNLTNRASSQTNIYYPDSSRYLDDGDAFRHTYWSALLAHEFGDDFAIQLTTAHESETEEGLDKDMDLHNNRNGVYLYHEWESRFSSISTDAWSDIGEFIYHCIANGEIYDCVKIDTINDKLVYTDIGYSNISKFNIKSYINLINITDYEFKQQYFFYTKTKSVTTSGGATVNTRRLRTGYIEEEYIVLSPRRSGAGFAFLEYEFATPVNSICVDLTLWSNQEYLYSSNCTAIVSSSVNGSAYEERLDLLNDISLSTNRNLPNEYRINFPSGTRYIKFSISSPATGDRNKGRICIGKMDVLFANLEY